MNLNAETNSFVPDLKMVLIALQAMEEMPHVFTFATIRHTIMLTEASIKSLAALEARIAALEAHHPTTGPRSAENLVSVTHVSGG